MNEQAQIQELSLFGGPLHRLGCRLGLIRNETNSFGLGLALGLLSWGGLILLTLLRGAGSEVFTLNAIGVHVRLLVAIPLFFLCESIVFPRMGEFARDLAVTGLVPVAELPRLDSVIRRISRWKDSWLAEAVFVAMSFGLPLVEMFTDLPGRTANLGSLLEQSGGTIGPILVWYLGFCLPLFRFLVLRWLWRLWLWTYFLWQVQKHKLHLVPTHPDRVAGLGYLEVVHEHFAPLAMAISAIYCASFAEDIVAGRMAFEAVYRSIPVVLVLCAILFIGPLFIFRRKLWACRIAGIREYMAMASGYVDAFDRRWIRDGKATAALPLGAEDVQSLADLAESVKIVEQVRMIPASRSLVLQLAVSAVLPAVPLFLLKYPVNDLAARLFQVLTGL